MPPRKRAKRVYTICSICGQSRQISFDLLHCCERCQDKVVEAEDDGGHWRTAYLISARLVECEGALMRAACAHLLPQLPRDGVVLDGGLQATVENAVVLLQSAPRVVILLGSGASAGYDIPINLASSSEKDPLRRYGPVRQAVLALGEDEIGGLYDNLRQLRIAIRKDAHARDGQLLCTSTAVISTNIDDLATRAGLPELQLHGTTARLQCAPCDMTWVDRDWPPNNCPQCGRRPLFNVPTNTLDEEDVVWRWIRQDRNAARKFLDDAAGAPLTVLALGIATHVHTLTPELQLVVEARAARGDETSVVWANQRSNSDALPGAMELIGDATETVARMLQCAHSRNPL